MRRCLEMAGRDMSKGRAKSVTLDSPLLSLARIARLVGLERAEKIWSSLAESAPRGLERLEISTEADLRAVFTDDILSPIPEGRLLARAMTGVFQELLEIFNRWVKYTVGSLPRCQSLSDIWLLLRANRDDRRQSLSPQPRNKVDKKVAERPGLGS